jgi:hypothetical protein
MERQSNTNNFDYNRLSPEQKVEVIRNLPDPVKKHIGLNFWKYVAGNTLGCMLVYDFTGRFIAKRKRILLFTCVWLGINVGLIRYYGLTYPIKLISDAKRRQELEQNNDKI